MDIVHSITILVTSLGPIGVLLASILEEIVVVIPSSLIQLGAGFFLLQGNSFSLLSLGKVGFFVALPAAVGVIIGSLPIYYLGYYGGEPAIRKWGKWFLVRWSHIERVSAYLAKRKITFWFFAFLKFLPFVPSAAITGFCGLVRIPLGRYVAITFLGVFARAFTLGSLGWLAGGFYEQLLAGFDQVESMGTLVIIVVVLGSLIYLYLHAKKLRAKKTSRI